MKISQPDVVRQAVSPQLVEHPDQGEVEKLRLMGAGDNPTETETRIGQELLAQQLALLGIRPVTNVQQLKSWHKIISHPSVVRLCAFIIWSSGKRVASWFGLLMAALALLVIEYEMHWSPVTMAVPITIIGTIMGMVLLTPIYQAARELDLGWQFGKTSEANTPAQAYSNILKLRQALPGSTFRIEHNPGTTGYFLMAGLAGYTVCLDYWRSGKQEPDQISIPDWIAGRRLVSVVEQAAAKRQS
jgi:hypothetical protein